MESKLNSLFRTSFAPAQSADSWMGIRRDEPQDQGRKKSPHDDKKSAGDDGGDVLTISIAALKSLLQALMHSASPDPGTPVVSVSSEISAAPPPAVSPQAARAAQAYQSASGPREIVAAPAVAPAVTPDLSTNEVRIIHKMMADLDTLTARGITTLPIRQQANLLDSVSEAIAQALATQG